MNNDHLETTDTEDESSVAEVYEESVTVQSEPFDSFDSFHGYTEAKQQLQRTVVETVGYDQYVTSSVFLVGDHIDCQTTTLAKGLTGEVDDEYTFFMWIPSAETRETNNIEATLEAARAQEPRCDPF